MDFESIIHMLRRGWILLAASALIGGAGGYVLAMVQPPTYEAATSLYVSVPGASNSSELAQGGTAAEQKVQSFANVAVSTRVLGPVIRDLGLDTTPQDLAKHVSAQTPIDSVLVNVTVTDGDPTQAAAIANGIGKSLATVVTKELEEPAQGASPFRIETIEPAVVPTAAASPNRSVYVVGGLLLGLLAGFAIAALRAALDNRLDSRADAESLAGAPAVGEVPLDKSMRVDPLVLRAEPTGPTAETFRRLRTNLQFLEIGRPTRSFLVTSSIPGEGKTTTIANTALALAENGLRVALVDADLRRPRIADVMGVDGTAGLTDVLIGRLELEDAEQPWGRDGLVVLPSGAVPPNPTELLGSGAMAAVIAELERRYDVVLVDAPPLLPVADAAVLTKLTGGALLVTAMHRTTRKQLAGARAALADVGCTAVGTIMTMAKAKRTSVYNYRYEAASESRRLVVDADAGGRHSRVVTAD
ncbi:polysaccharide biosynthesis tyrosine autokinase [Curtobacterium flaccumfaciens pv. oortii]|uniref:polysaccharide biosynthesis tyrosine autokinase n=1 Tax=Curtobacterium flaccumfaciens TaxID=2035 RepID=UPI001BDE4779|nr:polysaccharide biosynthesis tyrosine autokinase [Curtobacterium flaccumfaciens]MBT1624261.1 polysaccharide biosynthesis tyrosine autokinase [Curtobacterium flaccumfaciens pv. oortii]